jgi:hypothetical protein
MIKKIIIFTLLMFSFSAYAGETLTGFDEKRDLPILNDFLRKLPQGSAPGILLPSGAVFYMLTGDCPNGTTDVSATYANKFIKANATAGTSSGVVLTGATASHTLTTAEIPSHTHKNSDGYYDQGTSVTLSGGPSPISYHGGGASAGATGTNTGGGGGHTHNITTATTLEPSSITCRLCQVN